MAKIKKIKQMQLNGQFSDYMPIGADAENIDMKNSFSVQNVIGDINPDTEGNVSTQLKKIKIIEKECKISIMAPPAGEHIDLGDCSIITGTKNIIVDLSFQTDEKVLLKYLRDNNIMKIDYIVISHLHSDHIGGPNAQGLITLISQNDIDFSDCIVLLPHKDINYAAFVPSSATNGYQTLEQHIISNLDSHNIQYHYPSEGEIISIDENSQMQFFNLLPEYYEDYYPVVIDAYGTNTGYTNYNNFSMVMCYKHINRYMWFTGDIESKAQANI